MAAMGKTAHEPSGFSMAHTNWPQRARRCLRISKTRILRQQKGQTEQGLLPAWRNQMPPIRCFEKCTSLNRLRKNSIGLRLLGGAALQRCGKYFALFAAFSH